MLFMSYIGALRGEIASLNRNTLLAKFSYGNFYKEELIMALQDYQTRAKMYGNGIVEKVLARVSSDRITTEIRTSLLPIVEALEILCNNTSKTSDELTLIAHKIDSALSSFTESHEDIEKSNAEVSIN
jgi:hypothetical protein